MIKLEMEFDSLQELQGFLTGLSGPARGTATIGVDVARSPKEESVVKKDVMSILDTNFSDSQILTDEQIIELSNLIVQIEKHFKFPCDIEWAYKSGKFYIKIQHPNRF